MLLAVSIPLLMTLIETIENDEITTYYKREWFPECLYLLAMVDYVSRENNVSLCEEYNNLRKMKLKEIRII